MISHGIDFTNCKKQKLLKDCLDILLEFSIGFTEIKRNFVKIFTKIKYNSTYLKFWKKVVLSISSKDLKKP